jgi:hypothetical protein
MSLNESRCNFEQTVSFATRECFDLAQLASTVLLRRCWPTLFRNGREIAGVASNGGRLKCCEKVTVRGITNGRLVGVTDVFPTVNPDTSIIYFRPATLPCMPGIALKFENWLGPVG